MTWSRQVEAVAIVKRHSQAVVVEGNVCKRSFQAEVALPGHPGRIPWQEAVLQWQETLGQVFAGLGAQSGGEGKVSQGPSTAQHWEEGMLL